MKRGVSGSFGAQLKALREAAGFTQEELATIAGLSVHAVSALERGERRRPHVETVRALSAALDLTGASRDALVASAREPQQSAVDELSVASLPLPPTSLVGRDFEMQALERLLADPAARLITLTGPGGAGKTRLVLELARTVAAEGTTRVVFVPLGTIWNPAFVGSAIAEALGLSDVTASDLPKHVRVACADTSTLLVVDNFEQVLDAAPLVADLLISAARLRVLVTSRAPLHIRGEREYVVGPLALEPDAAATAPADLARAPAVRLLVERVRDVRPDFRLTAEDGPAVAAICRRLDGLPLALELAAPWMKTLTAQELLRRLANDVLRSAIGPRDLPERQQTMNATVAWSYRLLRQGEQALFRRLGALTGRFSIDAAAAVLAGVAGSSATADAALVALAGLIDKSLLQRADTSVPDRPLYQMLETVRAYAALELDSANERADALDGLAIYCTGEASRAVQGLGGPAQAQWLDRVRDDLENYRSAMTWLLERGQVSEASDIAGNLLTFWIIRGHAREGLRWYEQMLALPSIGGAAESKARLGAAAMLYAQGDMDRARDHLVRVLAIPDAASDMEMAWAQTLLAHVEHAVGNMDAAQDQFRRSVAGFRALALPWGIGNALSGLAWCALAAGDVDQAERLLDEATAVLRNAGPWWLLLTFYVRAILAVRRGDPGEAIALVRDSLERIRALHDKFAFVYALVPLAAAAALKGDDLWAARILGARDAVTESTGATFVDKSVHDLQEQAEREARRRLGPERWAGAYAAGRRMSIDALLNDIDRVVNASPT